MIDPNFWRVAQGAHASTTPLTLVTYIFFADNAVIFANVNYP
jgi:hypothetical protein